MKHVEISLSDYLSADDILIHIEGATRDQVIDRLISQLQSHIDDLDRDPALQAVLEREQLSPTVMAEGLALPHARLKGLKRPYLAMATSHEGIDFLNGTEGLVHVVVLILTPKDDPGSYLRLMASLSKVLAESHVLRRLITAASSREAFSVLTEGPEKVAVELNAANVMDRNPVTLSESDTLECAIRAFCANRIMDIPIVDTDGDLRGVIAIEDLLGQSLPQHLLWMEDLSPIENFEPFAEMLRKDTETKVADFMRDSYVAVPSEMPAIQLAKIFLMQQVRQIQVVQEDRFLGSVDLNSFSSQIFWA